jgi:hypothetical protein
MANILPSKQDTQQRDHALVKQIKPRLRKFLIDTQVQQASKTASQQKVKQEKLLSHDDLLKQAESLAKIAYFKLRVWREHPPYFAMQWITKGWGTPELVKEMNGDVAGFAYGLILEYEENYLKQRRTATRGYLNPMDEKNLVFFWQKWNQDLRVLVETDRRRKALGNAGVVIVGDPKKGLN